MQMNIGNIDKFIRVAVAILLFSLALVLPSHLKLLSLLGLVPLINAFVRWCPLYNRLLA